MGENLNPQFSVPVHLDIFKIDFYLLKIFRALEKNLHSHSHHFHHHFTHHFIFCSELHASSLDYSSFVTVFLSF